MADKVSYPQVPSTVWWGVRNLFQRAPNMTINERTLGVELNVQEAAARQYISELKRIGILSDDNKATAIAQKWRRDEAYAEAVGEILSNVYPEELIQVAPPDTADRQKVVSWFTREGLGTGTAGNKAATYLLIASATPNEPPMRGAASTQKGGSRDPQAPKRKPTAQAEVQKPTQTKTKQEPQGGSIPLNVNVQIHISADASSEQIESIFSAMRRYLYNGSA